MPRHKIHAKNEFDKCSEKVTLLVAMLDDPNFQPGEINPICEIFGIQSSDENFAIIYDGLVSGSVS